MIISIHQPNFFPWIGYFYKIANSDAFVFLDDVQYTKNSFINRNKIKTNNGEQWLTMPVIHTGKFGQTIKEVEIQFFEKNYKKIKNTLQMNYCKSTYYNEIIVMFDEYYDSAPNLASINEFFILWILKYLKIDTPIYKSSEMKNIQGESTDRLISICGHLNADKYLAGFGSKKYQDSEKFKKHEIEATVYDFTHPIYPQLWNDFIPNLSILDVLFNVGKDTTKLIYK